MKLFFFETFPKGRFQQKIKNGWINPSGLAGWGQPGSEIQKKIKF